MHFTARYERDTAPGSDLLTAQSHASGPSQSPLHGLSRWFSHTRSGVLHREHCIPHRPFMGLSARRERVSVVGALVGDLPVLVMHQQLARVRRAFALLDHFLFRRELEYRPAVPFDLPAVVAGDHMKYVRLLTIVDPFPHARANATSHSGLRAPAVIPADRRPIPAADPNGGAHTGNTRPSTEALAVRLVVARALAGGCRGRVWCSRASPFWNDCAALSTLRGTPSTQPIHGIGAERAPVSRME